MSNSYEDENEPRSREEEQFERERFSRSPSPIRSPREDMEGGEKLSPMFSRSYKRPRDGPKFTTRHQKTGRYETPYPGQRERDRPPRSSVSRPHKDGTPSYVCKNCNGYHMILEKVSIVDDRGIGMTFEMANATHKTVEITQHSPAPNGARKVYQYFRCIERKPKGCGQLIRYDSVQQGTMVRIETNTL